MDRVQMNIVMDCWSDKLRRKNKERFKGGSLNKELDALNDFKQQMDASERTLFEI